MKLKCDEFLNIFVKMLQQERIICRFCLFEDTDCAERQLLHLFQNFNYDNIIEKIENCLKIKLTSNDKIPPIICETCLEKVNCFSNFLELAANSEKQLKLLYGMNPRFACISQESYEAGRTPNNWLCDERLKTCRTESDFSISYKVKMDHENQQYKSIGVQRGKSTVALCESRKSEKRKREEVMNYRPQQIIQAKKLKVLCKICNLQVLSKNMGVHLHKHAEKFRSSPITVFKSPSSGKNPNKKIFCKICQKTFRTENRLAAHMKKMHESKKIRFSAQKKRRSTKRTFNIAMNNLVRPQKFKCKFCDKQFTSLKALHNHLSTHSRGKKKCPKCNRQFSSKNQFNRHLLQCIYDPTPIIRTRRTSLP